MITITSPDHVIGLIIRARGALRLDPCYSAYLYTQQLRVVNQDTIATRRFTYIQVNVVAIKVQQ